LPQIKKEVKRDEAPDQGEQQQAFSVHERPRRRERVAVSRRCRGSDGMCAAHRLFLVPRYQALVQHPLSY
jgi:hypothetical protein